MKRKLAASHRKKTFWPGSLLENLTPERDREQLNILFGCVQGPVESAEDEVLGPIDRRRKMLDLFYDG